MIFIQRLERRRMFSFAAVGADTILPVKGDVVGIDVASEDDGMSVIAAHVIDGDEHSIVATRYGAAGEQIGEPIFVDSYQLAGSAGPRSVSVSINDLHEAIIAFQMPAGLAEAEGIYVAHISSAGAAGAPILVKDAATTFGFTHTLASPTVSIDASGGYFVGWIDNSHAPGGSEAIDGFYAFARAFDADDEPLADAINLGGESDDRGYPAALEVAAYPDGSGAVFAFTDYRYDNNVEKLAADPLFYGRTSTSARLGSLSEPTAIDSWPDSFPGADAGGADGADQPSIAINLDNSFIIAYRRFNTRRITSDVRVQAAYAQRFDPDGEKVGEPIELGASLSGDGISTGTHSPAISFTPDDGFVATFIQTLGETDTLYARRFDSDAVPNAAGPVALAALAATPLDEAGIHLSPRSAISADLFGHASVAYIDDEKTGHVQRVSDSFAEIRGSTLLVFGTDSREVLDVAVNGSNFIATRGRESETFHAVGIHSLNISGFGGDDKIANGTTLNSSLSGGEGRDSIVGGEGNDSISGNAGNDTIRGDTGADRLAGNGGRDRLFGNGGNDQLYGGASADWLYGQNGSDQLFGEGGDDRLFDDYDQGIDTLHGNAGNDSFVTTDGTIDHIFGDGGSDSADADTIDVLTSIENA